MHSKIVIIGSGPAGLTAALYAARANLEPLVIRGLQPGGLIATTSEVENYPGFPESVGGFELAQKMEEQAARFGTKYMDALIESVDFSHRPFTLTTDGGEQVTADTVILSTGASPRKLGVPGEEELANRGVSYCATCDGFFFRNKRVVVVGGGDSALDEGLFLTRFVDELVIIHRRDKLRADPILQERAFANPKVRFVYDSVVTEVLGDDKVAGVRIKNLNTDEESILETDGVFPYIGHIPNTQVFTGHIDMDDGGYILADERTRTNIPGVYAAGDVVDQIYRQAVTAAGDGCKAAMEVTWFLDAEEHVPQKTQEEVVPSTA
ncbi:MAG: thioredoxin-disulfide reductase [Chloroflexi bacterium AL-W]|nr:thioredoxin-disulfide reductase [Chloroflexi bacterium AL-N1]NOK68980.1 thioredoxin-disulfide reductase [Chloroflexi bacterium AL-N10]NOK76963.1 thioredoxin-disulfide reductase [Chloroflexi bacterium AL-N5]NOK82649.1 thioredoxin-disulfide reductase [Chloroflexi bacterium AL-W]NOK90820.1 thioredoxin-disulfide reductase [Chloroflexi bacterium AL-N15]